MAVRGGAVGQHRRWPAQPVGRKRRRVVEPQRLHHRGSGILGASRAEDRREGRSEWRAVEVWASLQPTEILLAFLDLVPVLPLILVQLLEEIGRASCRERVCQYV